MTLEEISLVISLLALLISGLAVRYIREKIKLTKKDMWLRSISPEPHINIWDGKVGYKYEVDALGSATSEIEGFIISVDIANVTGYANEPKWIWNLILKDGKTIPGHYSDKGISLNWPGGQRRKISYIPNESQTYHLSDDVLGVDKISDIESIKLLRIWVNYVGKRDTEYYSYRYFKYVNKKWVEGNKRTKVRRVR